MQEQFHSEPLKVAVVGGGVAGIAAAYALQRRHRVVVFDPNDYLGDHYAITLARWHENVQANRERIAQLGLDRPFRRKWAYYLGSCEAGFRERVLGNLQLVLTREGNDALRTF